MQQFGSALKYIHSKGIVHTDLKTENILLKSSGAVTVIDFGCAIYEKDYHPPALGTQEYRSPEALLQCGWSYPTDIWSAGCIFAELLIGETLFPHGATEDIHLSCIQTCLGHKIPQDLLSRASSHPNPSNPIRFISYSHGAPHFAPRTCERRQSETSQRTLAELLRLAPQAELLRRMLVWEPARRATAAGLHQALMTLKPQPASDVPHVPRPASQPPSEPGPAPSAGSESVESAAPPALLPCLERAGSAPPNLPSPLLRPRRAAQVAVAPMESSAAAAVAGSGDHEAARLRVGKTRTDPGKGGSEEAGPGPGLDPGLPVQRSGRAAVGPWGRGESASGLRGQDSEAESASGLGGGTWRQPRADPDGGLTAHTKVSGWEPGPGPIRSSDVECGQVGAEVDARTRSLRFAGEEAEGNGMTRTGTGAVEDKVTDAIREVKGPTRGSDAGGSRVIESAAPCSVVGLGSGPARLHGTEKRREAIKVTTRDLSEAERQVLIGKVLAPPLLATVRR